MREKGQRQLKSLSEQGMPVVLLILKLLRQTGHKNLLKTDSKRLKELAIQSLGRVEKTLLTFDRDLGQMNGELVHKMKVALIEASTGKQSTSRKKRFETQKAGRPPKEKRKPEV